MLTQTQTKIMQLFVSQITKQFTLRQAGKILNMHQALSQRSGKGLLKKGLIVKNENNLYSLKYRENHQDLAYLDNLRTKEFLNKPKNKTFSMFAKEVIEYFPKEYFVFLIFGSAVEKLTPRDIDILVIIEKTEEIESMEKAFFNISRKYTLNLHSVVVSFESVYEMLSKREEKNVINEVLNKHLILYGGELFYRLIKKGRK